MAHKQSPRTGRGPRAEVTKGAGDSASVYALIAQNPSSQHDVHRGPPERFHLVDAGGGLERIVPNNSDPADRDLCANCRREMSRQPTAEGIVTTTHDGVEWMYDYSVNRWCERGSNHER